MHKHTYDLGTQGSVTLPLIYIRSDAELYAAYEWLSQQTELGYDLETSGLDPRKEQIATIQVGNPLVADPRAYVIDVRCVSREALQPLFAILESPSVRLIGQNLKFEAKWTLQHYGVWIRNLYDCMVTELTCRAGLLGTEQAQQNGKQAKATDQEAMALKDKRRALKKTPAGGGAGSERKVYVPCSMGRMAQRYLGIEIDKDHWLRTSFFKTPAGEHNWRQLCYAAGDVVYPFYMRPLQEPMIRERGLAQILRVEHELLPILAHAELRGIQLDVNAWRVLADEAQQEYLACQAKLDQLVSFLSPAIDLFSTARPVNPWTGKVWNWDSPAQVRDAILAYCEHIKWPYRISHDWKQITDLKRQYGGEWLERRNRQETKTAKDEGRAPKLLTVAMVPEWLIPDHEVLLPDTDGKRLKVLHTRNLLPRELVGPLMDLSKASQRLSTYGEQFITKYVDPEDHAVRTEMHSLAAATGRITMQPNLQSTPRDSRYRAAFVPRPGYKFCIADLSQIEPRLLAQVSGDPTYVETYQQGKDLYVAVGERMYGQTIDKHTPEGKALRQRAKVAVLALAYMMGPAKYRNEFTQALSEDILSGKAHDLDLGEATEQRELFFQACPGVRPYQEDCVWQTNWTNPQMNTLYDDLVGELVTYMKSPCGRIRLWTQDMNSFAEAVNCVDANTEILTSRGWLNHTDLHDSDKILSVDPTNGSLVWSDLLNVVRKQHVGTLERFRGKTFDALSTAEHRWLVKAKKSKALRFFTTATLPAGDDYSIVRAASLDKSLSPNMLQPDVCALLAWVLTDGGIRRNAHGKKYQISLYQSVSANAEKVATIDALFARNPAWLTSKRVREDSQCAVYLLSPCARDLVLKYVSTDRTPKQDALIPYLTKTTAQLMIEVAIKADGNGQFEPRQTPRLFVRSQSNADWWQVVGSLAGWATSVCVMKPRVSVSKRFGFTARSKGGLLVKFLRRDTFQPVAKTRQKVEYSGIVWCPTTSTGTWVARRSGKVFVTGNCPIQSSSATGIKLAMVLLQRRIRQERWDAHILLSVHDELVVEAADPVAPAVAVALKECMESAFSSFCPDVPVVAEFPEASDHGVCDRWLK